MSDFQETRTLDKATQASPAQRAGKCKRENLSVASLAAWAGETPALR